MGPVRRQRRQQSKQRLANVQASQSRTGLLTKIAGRGTVSMLKYEKGKVDHVGCGVLTSLGDDVFIFTAVHVLQDFIGHEIYVPLGDDLVQVGGLADGSRALDAAILRVENPNLEAFHAAAIPAGVVFAQSQIRQDKLAIFCRPANPLTKNGEATIYQVRGKDQSFYKRLQADPAEKILLNYPKTVIGPTGPIRYPSLQGMSGSGVWFVPQENDRELSIHATSPLPRLLGIFTEQRRRENCLVATNVQQHVRCVWAKFPELLKKYSSVIQRQIEEQQQREEELRINSAANPETLRRFLEEVLHSPGLDDPLEEPRSHEVSSTQ